MKVLFKTSAGEVHFGQRNSQNYFAHTRVEDMADGQTRRVIEAQSDLFQKGNLEREYDPKLKGKSSVLTPERVKEIADKADARHVEMQKLEPYRNTWHERIVREEVKQAAKDGKKILQFPTGETAMKIEGLDNRQQWSFALPDEEYRALGSTMAERLAKNEVSESNMKVGAIVRRRGHAGENSKWVITDVLGDGKFKAIPKQSYDTMLKVMKDYPKESELMKRRYSGGAETFDISGKVDENNPIYKFYEKEMGKYLKNKYGATQITDKQGVKWWQVNVDKAKAKAPVEAFAAIPGSVALAQSKRKK